jgi:AraC-like DNA-binding protein
MDFDSHTHDFHKLIICLGGSVTYIIEGKTYTLGPWDILLVPKNKIHHSKTDSVCAYERIVLFIDDSYLASCDSENTLSEGFRQVEKCGKCMFHADRKRREAILSAAESLENAAKQKDEHASKLLQNAFFSALIIYINRLVLSDGGLEGTVTDKKLDEIISYINENFNKQLTVELLAKKFYISRSYLMHRFKAITGGSVHGYINQKRLSAALSMLRDGQPAKSAAQLCGFTDYTVFYKSFKKVYGFSPADVMAKKQ